MKLFIATFFCLSLISQYSDAQNIGIGTSKPDSSAKLEVFATDKGFLPPRMTFAQRLAIPNPAAGLIIWCTDCNGNGELQAFNGTNWSSLLAGSSNPSPTVTICGKKWQTKNLNVDKYRNGDPIPYIQDSLEWAFAQYGAWRWLNSDPNNAKYGRLYNWYAASDPRGLAPEGWHVPSRTEWNELSNCLGGDSLSGGKLKTTGIIESGTGEWASPNTAATNNSGFTALPGEYYQPMIASKSIGYFATFWGTTDTATGVYLRNNSSKLNKIWIVNNYGFSVRTLATDSGISLPVVNTGSVLKVTDNSIICSGNVVSNGGSEIFARGLVWSAWGDTPTIAEPYFNADRGFTREGQGLGSFSSKIRNLYSAQPYLVRAYAANAKGVAYGNTIAVNTTSVSYCDEYGTPVVQDSLLGDYPATISYNPYGPLDSSNPRVESIISTGPTSARVSISKLLSSSMPPIEFDLDWTDPFNKKATVVYQDSIPGSDAQLLFASSSVYSGRGISVQPAENSTGSERDFGRFNFCNQEFDLKIRFGVTNIGWFGNYFRFLLQR